MFVEILKKSYGLQDGLGGFFPASNYIDLGLFQHAGAATATQKAPVKYLSCAESSDVETKQCKYIM